MQKSILQVITYFLLFLITKGFSLFCVCTIYDLCNPFKSHEIPNFRRKSQIFKLQPHQGKTLFSVGSYENGLSLHRIQIWKLKKKKGTYFCDQRSTWWVMTILLFYENTRHPIILVSVRKYSHQSILVKLTSSNVFSFIIWIPFTTRILLSFCEN